MLLLFLYVTPLAVWDSQNHCETLQGFHKRRLRQYHCLDVDCGLGIACSSVYHWESMLQLKQCISVTVYQCIIVTVPVSTLTSNSIRFFLCSLFSDGSHGDYFLLHLASSFPAQKSRGVLVESQKHLKSLSNKAADTFSMCWLPLYVPELCIYWESTIMMVSSILSALFFNIFIQSSIFFCMCHCPNDTEAVKQREAHASIEIKSILKYIS